MVEKNRVRPYLVRPYLALHVLLGGRIGNAALDAVVAIGEEAPALVAVPGAQRLAHRYFLQLGGLFVHGFPPAGQRPSCSSASESPIGGWPPYGSLAASDLRRSSPL